MLQDAVASGLPRQSKARLGTILEQYADVFRLKLGTDPPVQIEPMIIKLQQNAKPVSVKVRRYTPPQAIFLKNKVQELERNGLVRRNGASSWACAPLIVPKPGPEQFRFTTDLRPVNKVTIPHIWPMPDLESSLGRLKNQKVFALIDLCQVYWQLPLHENSQECQSFITPDGMFSPTRVMHGQPNAVSYCQSSIQLMCKHMLDKFLQWLDDLLFFATTADELLTSLEAFFEVCAKFGLKLHAAKCKLFLKEVRWCGRVIGEQGIRMDPARLEALLHIEKPVSGDQLQQFVCAANWMRAAIPEFTKTMAPLAELLEKVYKDVGRRTRRAASKVKLQELGWNEEHTKAFDDMKTALAHATTLAYPDSDKALCLFTDASDHHWSGILTQMPHADLDLDFDKQRHEPLAFLSGSFKGASSRWSTPEKEASAIIFCCQRLDYLLMREQGFHLFTDHSNLVFLYHPQRSNIRMNKTIYSKVQRWSLILSMYEYTIVHIKGEENCWADLLSRWAKRTPPVSEGEKEHRRIAALLRAPLARAPLAPDMDPSFS